MNIQEVIDRLKEQRNEFAMVKRKLIENSGGWHYFDGKEDGLDLAIEALEDYQYQERIKGHGRRRNSISGRSK